MPALTRCCVSSNTPARVECLVTRIGLGDPGLKLIANRLASVGGNAGAPASPEGYAYPGAVVAGTSASNGDRPFGGSVSITKNPGDMIGIAYLELERWDPIGSAWVPLPAGAEVDFAREYWEPGATPPTQFPAFPVLTLSGHRVWKTRERFDGAWFWMDRVLMNHRAGDKGLRFRRLEFVDQLL